MARRRTATPEPTRETPNESVAALRFLDRSRTDWAFDAEGSLLVYDPEVVTDDVFAQLYGFQTLAACALGWMNGGGGTPAFLGETFHESPRDRSDTAARLGLLTRLGWEGSLALLPFCVARNGADVRLRTTPLTADEAKAHASHARGRAGGRGPVPGPERAWVVTRGPRLGLTWTFFLGFRPDERRANFGPGHAVEVAWPAGAHAIKGWALPEREDDDGCILDQYVLQLESWV